MIRKVLSLIFLFSMFFIDQLMAMHGDEYTNVKSLKELTARSILSQPADLVELKKVLTIDAIEYIWQIINKDSIDLPELIVQRNKSIETLKIETCCTSFKKFITQLTCIIAQLGSSNDEVINFNEDNLYNIILNDNAGALEQFIELLTLFMKTCKTDLWNKQEFLEFVRFVDYLLETSSTRLKILKQVSFILANKNIDSNCKYQDKTAFEWAKYYKDAKILELLKNFSNKNKN